MQVPDTLHKTGLSVLAQSLGMKTWGKTFAVRESVLARLRLNLGQVISVDEILDFVYGYDANGGPENGVQSLRTAIWKLRREGFEIQSVSGRGYVMKSELCREILTLVGKVDHERLEFLHRFLVYHQIVDMVPIQALMLYKLGIESAKGVKHPTALKNLHSSKTGYNLKRLEAMGYVTTALGVYDLRIKTVKLTAKGEEIKNLITKAFAELESRVSADLELDLAKTGAVLRTLDAVLSADQDRSNRSRNYA